MKRKPRRNHRPLRLEHFESRQLLASDWQNGMLMRDVDNSNNVTPLDALLVVNLLNEGGSRTLQSRPEGSTEPYCDVSGDGILNPIDVLLVINALNKYTGRPTQLSANISVETDPNQNGVVLGSNVKITGRTLEDVGIQAVLAGSPLVAQVATANGEGSYEVTIQVPVGSHTVQLTAIDDLGRRESFELLVRHGDLAQDWNRAALDVIRNWTTTSNDPFPNRIVTSQPPAVARNLAMISTAMFDAANAVQQEYESYLFAGERQSAASEEAAAASAAYQVAKTLYPNAKEMVTWEASYQESLREIGDGNAKALGIALGQSVASQILANRSSDGATATSTYQPTDEPGKWNRTAPDFLPPLLPQWGNVKPFVMETSNQFRPVAPPALTSAEYASDVQEVRELGSQTSTTRTDEQSQIAQFWAGGSGTITPPGYWNQIATDVALKRAMEGQGNSLVDNTRIYALLNLALADAGIASWDAKYAYDVWRPIDAIREASTDGNEATSADPNWTPLLKTPPFPSFTSGHSTFSGAGSKVLTSIYGTNFAFTTNQDTQMGSGQRAYPAGSIMVRQFDSFDEAADEAGMSRIYGGIHYMFDNTAGLSSGRAIGNLVATTALKPVGT